MIFIRNVSAIPVRLQGPFSSKGAGRLEIFYKGEWGTVCDDFWDKNDAQVVCRELGYKYTIRTILSDLAPMGPERMWLDDVHCNGNEQNLSSCSHSGWGNHDCRAFMFFVGVECSSAGNMLHQVTRFLPSCFNPGQNH